MAQYTTKINLKKRKRKLVDQSKYTHRNSRVYAGSSKKKKGIKNILSRLSFAKKEKFQKILAVALGVGFVVFLVGFLLTMNYLKTITEDLPSPDAPFGRKAEASIILAANQVDGQNEQLYKLFGDENRDTIQLEDIPEYVQWSFLAAEDIDFYKHPGFDVAGITRAGLYEVFKVGTPSGGSTITQQLIKQVIGDERSYNRKVKEIILALEVERRYSKEEILEMYLNTINFGGNNHGLKTAAKFYFNKEVSELTLAETAVLVRIPQSPLYNSPTLAPDPELGRENALKGREYVLNQLTQNFDKVNDAIENEEDKITIEMIDEAREQELVYEVPRIDIKAPHFVFYAQKLLTTQGYNNGEPFDLNELRTGGYKIYTTLNMEIQRIAEEEVLNGVNTYSLPNGGHNGSAIVTNPKNGDILAMVGSKSYDAESEGKLFDGKVNVADSPQSMGSSMKPTAYYAAFAQGTLAPGSYVPDIEIELGTYKPKNYDGRFKGLDANSTVRAQFIESRNIPAIIAIEAAGLENYLDTLAAFGYSEAINNRQNYGYSATLGGIDVTLVEHAQAYGVFANGGDLVKTDPIQKIVKVDFDSGEEEVVYEKEPAREQVADPQAVYLVNNVLNINSGGTGIRLDGRDSAGKTGTSDGNRDVSYAGYTSDFVVVGWNGNNDNERMGSRAFGVTVTKPWIGNIMQRITPFFPEAGSFERPGGIISSSGCSADDPAECGGGNDLVIADKIPPAYLFVKKYRVCSDQQDHLARDIDEQVGKAMDLNLKIYKMPTERLQPFVDRIVQNQIPTEFCTVSRSPNDGKPWASFNSPGSGASVSGNMSVNIKGFSTSSFVTKIELYLQGSLVSSSSSDTLTDSIDVSSYEAGTYTLRARVYDNTGAFGDSSINIAVNGTNSNFNISTTPNSPTNGVPATVNVSYGGSSTMASMKVYIVNPGGSNEVSGANISSGTYLWTPQQNGAYKIYIVGTTSSGIVMTSTTKNVTVN
ncbi:MAG TPA: transglycosylase domain-containing protein [Candidatus Dojkabacteria bacterium]